MSLQLEKLFSMQRKLDGRIAEEHDLKGDLIAERTLALQVELGELANETRCFKFWSLKSSSPREVILEEYVDGVHFILSLGLSYGYEQIKPETIQKEGSLVQQFQTVYDTISALRKYPTKETYLNLFNEYLTLGNLLGFNEREIQEAYEEKNKVNHTRQDTGY
ncbi:dUTP diphosphatase [Bacillus taeanensis]|uniref:dUTPase n=1 Tax=Bacillus taeanensis TaxID=273032 RepID=A0A366XYN6_9BACI|nr:dUTP diphosphatase [Bacillus taeanensis]RBW71520.1 dUTPase [Bacillus taeanensis]